jgi:hypothetical protein
MAVNRDLKEPVSALDVVHRRRDEVRARVLAIESIANVLAKVVRGLENIIDIMREEQRKTDVGPLLLWR